MGRQWIKPEARDYRSELSDTLDLVVGGLAGRGRRAGMYGALLLAVYDPAGDRFQDDLQVRHRLLRRRAGRLPPAWPSPGRRRSRTPRWHADVWFEPTLVVEVLAAELTVSPHHTAKLGSPRRTPGWLSGSPFSPAAAGARTRPPPTPPPWPRSWRCSAPPGGHPLVHDPAAGDRSVSPDAAGRAASLYFRAFYGPVKQPLPAPDGTPTNAVRGFLDMMSMPFPLTRATDMVACIDTDWRPAWRVALVPSYKTHRLAVPNGPRCSARTPALRAAPGGRAEPPAG